MTKTIPEIILSGAAIGSMFVNGILASGFGAAAYYFYRYHRDGTPISLKSLFIIIFLGFFTGFLAHSAINVSVVYYSDNTSLVTIIAAAHEALVGISGFMTIPILSALIRLDVDSVLNKVIKK